MTRSCVLAVTSQVPWPPDRGGHIRSFHLLRSLAARAPLTLIAGSRDGDVDPRPFAEAGISLRPVALRRHNRLSVAAAAVRASLQRQAYVCYRRHASGAMRKAVSAAVRELQPSLVYLDHLDSFVFAGLAGRTPRVIDLHNVYSTLVDRAADEADPLRRLYLRREARLLDRAERQAIRDCDLAFAVSQEDQWHFERAGAKRMVLIPNGVDCDAYASLPVGHRSGVPTILYVGTLSWPPNATAVHFLANDLLPAVRRTFPEARLRVVGRNPGADLLAYRGRPGIEIADDVPDVRPHLASAHVAAVPLTAGGGSRLKILEAFAAGVPVVSTAVGCEGLEVEHNRHLVIASLEDFVTATVRVLAEADLANRLAAAARELAQRTYDWRQIGARAAAAALSVAAAPR